MTTVTVRSLDNYQQQIIAGDHVVYADEPIEIGGHDSGPNPYELLLGALGACTAITVRMYAQRKQWDLQGIEVELTHEKDYVKDCENCEQDNAKLDRVTVKIMLKGDLNDQQRERLQYIATRCPVNKTLGAGLKIVHT